MSIKNVEKWGVFELVYKGELEVNPFTEAEVCAEFKIGGRKVSVNGFYNGNGEYKIRFMPDVEGTWSYSVSTNAHGFDGECGEFLCTAPSEGNHGPVRVIDRYHFAYEDGTPHHPIGTTSYVWNHQSEELEKQTLETLKTAPFNKMRMCVFPKHYTFNANEPRFYPFEGSLKDGWDFERFNPQYFEHLEECIVALMDMGIEADLILFHEYDRWGFSKMPAEADDRYLKYLAARISAYRNLWWSFANEYDLMGAKTLADWDRFFKIIQQYDPYNHLRSIHNCRGFYDHGKPWVTHCSIQHSDIQRTTEWLDTYKKPVVIDECCYEGNITNNWGNITAEEMSNRMWEAYARGGYAGHGETYMHPDDILWWAKGGKLHGQSPERIAFLVKIINEAPGYLVPTTLNEGMRFAVGYKEDYFLVYVGNRQPIMKTCILPEGRKYKCEVIDTWEMTITELEGEFEGACEIPLPGKPYQAVRFIAAD